MQIAHFSRVSSLADTNRRSTFESVGIESRGPAWWSAPPRSPRFTRSRHQIAFTDSSASAVRKEDVELFLGPVLLFDSSRDAEMCDFVDVPRTPCIRWVIGSERLVQSELFRRALYLSMGRICFSEIYSLGGVLAPQNLSNVPYEGRKLTYARAIKEWWNRYEVPLKRPYGAPWRSQYTTDTPLLSRKDGGGMKA